MLCVTCHFKYKICCSLDWTFYIFPLNSFEKHSLKLPPYNTNCAPLKGVQCQHILIKDQLRRGQVLRIKLSGQWPWPTTPKQHRAVFMICARHDETGKRLLSRISHFLPPPTISLHCNMEVLRDIASLWDWDRCRCLQCLLSDLSLRVCWECSV